MGYNIKEWHESCEEKKLDSFMLGTASEENDPVHMNTDAQEKCNLFDSIDPSTILQLVFNSVEEADQFYIDYATAMGFNVRKSHKENRKGSNIVKNRELVCSRAGFRVPLKEGTQRIRKPKPETRCGCEARIRFAHDISNGLYRVTDFNPYHNHPLETTKTAHVLKVNRTLTKQAKLLLGGLTFSGIRVGKAMDFMEHLEGGPGKLPFRRKDGYNHLNKERMQRVRQGDVNCALTWLEAMKSSDKDLIFSYTVDNEKTLTKLFWTDGMSRAEFRLFGDVLVFDSTYKTNTYRFPLVLFCGVNNHLGTCVFGGALLFNETVDSYRWLLQEFRAAMGGLSPKSILTDQDAAMRIAIELEFPEAKHRICSWHLERNALNNVKIPQFTRDFGALLKKNYSIGEFEVAWMSLIEKHGVANHPWVIDMYRKRELWSEAYCRGHFMGMMRTTQRAESLNALFKLSGNQGFKITELLKHYHNTVGKIRAKFFENQEDAERSTPMIKDTALRILERQAASFYTNKVFSFVLEEIVEEQGLLLEESIDEGGGVYSFKFGRYDKIGCRSCNVSVDWLAGKLLCDCRMLESDGLPCRHIFSSLKYLGETKFPDICISKRWTVAIGTELHGIFHVPFPDEEPQRLRFAKLHKEAMNLCLQASQSVLATEKYTKRLRIAADCAQEDVAMGSQVGANGESAAMNPLYDLCDPKRILSRGAPRSKLQNCGRCGEAGHKATTCTNQKQVRCKETTGKKKMGRHLNKQTPVTNKSQQCSSSTGNRSNQHLNDVLIEENFDEDDSISAGFSVKLSE